jgi:hypothetical protein
MRDFIFKPEATGYNGVDRTLLKKNIAGILGDRMVDGKARYLFSAEPLMSEPGEWFRVRTADDAAIEGMKEIPIQGFKVGAAVTLSSWIAISGDTFQAGEPPALLATRSREKLRALCEGKFNDAMDIWEVDTSRAVRVMKAVSKGQRLCRPYSHVTVTGTVKNIELLHEIELNGLGYAKAYGFGLVVARHH